MDKIYYELTINKEEELYVNNDKYWQVSGIVKKDKFSCYRCGNENLSSFNNYMFCDNCLEFGKVSEKTLFFQKERTNRYFEYVDKLSEIRYGKKQLIATKYINSCIVLKKDCLIHAVCGAGKTEITFSAISNVLKKNNYVCFAIPRIDILYEISSRLKYYFPKTKVCVLNSNEEKIQNGQIYVMTTNQIIKFKYCFDLIIVDEIDAFPFEYNLKYDFGVVNAKTQDGTIIYLTSTPSKKFLEKEMPVFLINRRWHERRLPIPIFEYFDISLFLKFGNKKFIKMLKEYDENRVDDKQLILFISNIKIGQEIVKKIKKFNIIIPFVFSTRTNRMESIADFRQKKCNILLTTAILERGVTFNNIDVIVLDATSKMYNKSSLIQIAGRVGRKKEYQNGKVFFYYNDITKNMKDCKKDIEKFNI